MIDFNPEPFQLLSVGYWGLMFVIFMAAMALIALGVSFGLHRGRGFRAFRREANKLARDAVAISPRRVWALTMLTFREATRRKALLVFVVFGLIVMFAGWYMSEVKTRPEMHVKNHVEFVLWTTSVLVLVVMLLLSCWGLPSDIKARSLHTVVTKPARRNEVYLGRLLGFTLIGTLLIAVMGGIGYVWIERQLPPEVKEKQLVCRVPVFGKLSFLDTRGLPGKGVNVGDIWDFRSFVQGNSKARAVWTFENVTPERMGNEIHLESRFEVFRTHKGNQKRGVQCEYHFVKDLRTQTANDLAATRGFQQVREKLLVSDFAGAGFELKRVAGGLENGDLKPTKPQFRTLAAGFASFAELLEPLETGDDTEWVAELRRQAAAGRQAADSRAPSDLASVLQEMAAAFETHAKRMQKVLIDLEARRPPFSVKEFHGGYNTVVKPDITYKINGKDELHPGNLFEDIVHGGKLKVQLVCLDSGQYVGVARPDLFIRMPDRDFAVGYTKALVTIWLLMVLVVILGVTASTFLKGPIATLLVFVFLILGSPFHDFLKKMDAGDVISSGAWASAVRLINHQNPQVKIEQSGGTKIFDKTLLGLVKGVYRITPDFDNYRASAYVANGFDVPWNSSLLPALMTTLGFLVPCFILGYVSLAKRELEEK